jgi:hypothetical protein
MAELSGIQQALQKLSEQVAKDQGATTPAADQVAKPEDIQRLQAALNPPPPEVTDKVQGVATSSEMSPGARILHGMSNLRSNYEQLGQDMMQIAAKPNPSTTDLAELQFKMLQLTTQQDLMGKVVTKSEQNIDTLLKGQ